MTGMYEGETGTEPSGIASTSQDSNLDLLRLRLNGAQLGAMLGVSRQAVSSAVKRGTISSVGPDGLFDSRRAVREWMANTDPTRVRARALKPGAELVTELRARLQDLAVEISQLRDELAVEKNWGDQRELAATFRAEEAADRALSRVMATITRQFTEASSAHAAGGLSRWLNELVAVEFYGQDLDEYRADVADGDDIASTTPVR